MRFETGSIRDTRQIAAVYSRAFSDSVQFFFAEKKPALLLEMLELSFRIVFLWGGQAVVAKSGDGNIYGYCLYSSTQLKGGKDLWGLISAGLRLLTKISAKEAARLAYNKIMMSTSAERRGRSRSPRARIISIAVDPAEQARGLGTGLLCAALTELEGQSVALNVRSDNAAGRRLYQEAGFAVCGRTKDLQGEWLMLWKDPDQPV